MIRVKTIKTRAVRRDIKIHNPAPQIAARARQAALKTKEAVAKQVKEPENMPDSPEQFAANEISEKAQRAVQQTARSFSRPGKKARQKSAKARHGVRRTREQARSAQEEFTELRKLFKIEKSKNVKSGTKSVKNQGKSVKNNTKNTKNAAQTAAKSAQKSRAAFQQARQFAQKAEKITRQSIKTAVAAVKTAVRVTQTLAAALAAGGWIVLVVLVVALMLGLLLSSGFGIFFLGQKTNGEPTMTEVIQNLNREFYAQIELLEHNHVHDVLDTRGALAVRWDEVLAVYAVKTTTDPENPMEVLSVDATKTAILRGILFDMNTISGEIQSQKTSEGTIERTLIVKWETKSASEMAKNYHFDANQEQLMNELLDKKYADLWAQLLGGYVPGRGEILVGNKNWAGTGVFDWPLAENFPITWGFGFRKDPFTGLKKFHNGIDIICPEGTPILAAADGVVVVANSMDSWGSGWGYHVKLTHENGLETLYAHCSKIAVSQNQAVKKGQVIAFVGNTGRSNAAHLHWEVYLEGVRVDPLKFFVQN